MKVWQLLAIVALGVASEMVWPGRFGGLVGPATLYVLLPPLLFEAAWSLDGRAVRRGWRAIAILAGPGVLVTAAIVAGALLALRVPFGSALVTGAILSATDPIAVVAVFRRLRAPKTLVTLVECESLFNDATAVLLYRGVLLLALVGWNPLAIGGVAATALLGAAGGVAIGVAYAYVAARVLRRRAGMALQVVATALCAYGAYFLADRIGASGIFATIACGLALRRFERRRLTLELSIGIARAWDAAALAANAVVFFLVGAALQIGSAVREPLFALGCVAAVVVARIAVAGLIAPAGFPPSWLAVVRVAGLRGALSLALALALPAGLPYRQAIVDGTFAVALVTIVVGALIAAPIVRGVGARRRPAPT